MNDAQWFVSDAETAEVIGPLTGDELAQRIAAGHVNDVDLIWCEGMIAWQKAEHFAWLLEP